jgi:hypothetical protein
MPIREHILQFLPPSSFLAQSLRTYFYSILKLYTKYKDEQQHPLVDQIASNLGNLQEALQLGLSKNDPNLADTIYCALSLNSFYRLTGRGHTPLIDIIPRPFPQPTDHHLEASFCIQLIFSGKHTTTVNPEILIPWVLSQFQHFSKPVLQCKSHIVFSVILSKCHETR